MAKGKLILILGGARSGKSSFAQELARRMGGRVLFVATAEPLDEEMRKRILRHQKNRPPHWKTLETTSNIGERIRERIDEFEVVIVDCVTILVSNILTRKGGDEVKVEEEIEGLIKCVKESGASFIIVSNEVGMGIVPHLKLGRIYQDLLGRVNQMLAHHANEVYFMIAGIPIRIKG